MNQEKVSDGKGDPTTTSVNETNEERGGGWGQTFSPYEKGGG